MLRGVVVYSKLRHFSPVSKTLTQLTRSKPTSRLTSAQSQNNLGPSIRTRSFHQTLSRQHVNVMASSGALPATIFNRGLYTAILTHWFGPTFATASSFPPEIMKRWFAVGSPEDNAAFDAECKAIGQQAFDFLHPDNYALPPFESFAKDLAATATLAQPFQRAIEVQHSEAAGAALKDEDVALAFLVLLDQLTRNTFRSVKEQALVYAHYDRLSRAILHQVLAPGNALTGLDRKAYLRSNVMKNVFFYMPLMHSEDLVDHDSLGSVLADLKQVAAGEAKGLEYVNNATKFEKEHRELIERFGRYPHRNAAMDRKPTPEEKAFLESGGKTFGVDSSK